jgi:inosine-uridine nucleoside N-ribohydrolase
MHLHDPMAIMATTTSSLFKFTKLKVDVEIKGELTLGQTVTEHRLRFKWGEDKPEITVACDVNGPALIDLFIKRIQSLK